MKILILPLLVHLTECQYQKKAIQFYQQPIVQPARAMMYPVRTNCQYVWCNQNRYRWNYRPTEFFNPCPSGRPLMNEYETPVTCNYLNQPNGGCPEDYWCHTGASFSTTSCCPRTDTEDRCEMRRDTGEGNELVARWYYDKNAKQCRRFLYKGLRGNMNNFV
ncbi:Kunitz/Bovine pancreatic trypsin inhibitor domain protein, partial [Cooperia oncophora]